MSWSWINRPPLWAPLTLWMQGINYLWFNSNEEAVGFIWMSSRWSAGCPFSFNIVWYVTHMLLDEWWIVSAWRWHFFGAARQVTGRRAQSFCVPLYGCGIQEDLDKWHHLQGRKVSKDGLQKKKNEMQDFNPKSHSKFVHQVAPKTPPCPTPTPTHHILQEDISRFKKRPLCIMMMQDPRKQALLPQWTPLPTLVPFGISWWLNLGLLSGLEPGV